MTRLAVAAVCCSLFLPALVLSPYRLGLLALVACYATASLAQNLITGFAGVLSLGNVAFLAASAYSAGALIQGGQVPWPVALAVGVAAAGGTAFVVGLPSLRISGMRLGIVTLVLVFAAQELMQQRDQAQGQIGVTVARPAWLLQDRGLYVAGLIGAMLSYAAIWSLLRSRSGRGIVAGSENEHAAAASGVNAARYRLLAFTVAGVVTGIAGVVYLYYYRNVSPGAFPLDLSIAFLTMMVLGGTRSLPGSVLGAVIIGELPQALDLLPGSIGGADVQSYVPGIYAVLLLLALRFFPEGLWPALVGVWTRRRLRPLSILPGPHPPARPPP